MEYFLLSPQGQADAREETPWDMPWTQAPDSDALKDYYVEVEEVQIADLFYTSKGLLFIPLGSDGLKVRSPYSVVLYEGFVTSNIVTLVPIDSDGLSVRI